MEGQIVAEVSVIPVGTGDAGISQYIAGCLEVLERKKDLSYRLTPMGTVVEGSITRVLAAVRDMHEAPFNKGVSRVVTHVKIDDRRDKPATMASKIESVLKVRPSIKV